eukprot:CAMPEP_0182438908 /NCGR_PEP_ID=MMETSP1167-20130531/86098_1 /TAXON_ID=2988 /ORGANISM="Mallomonas Sp, Strain CCMP3275" /LENGTH=213 /DNA_ID=CAMNT_0024632459 /DNA_START=278 /DNA_END=918 /DNA_ORIENTATION=+
MQAKLPLLERIKTQFGPTPGLSPDKIPPTVGMNLAKIVYKGAQVIFWDLGGQSKMRVMWEKYYQEADAVVYVVDSQDLDRLEEAKLAYDATCDHDELALVPIFTFANKQDLEDAMSPGDLAVSFYHREDDIEDCEGSERREKTGGKEGGTIAGRGRGREEQGERNRRKALLQEAEQERARVMGVSAVTGHGLEEAVSTVVVEARRLTRRAARR